jgi:hypothetical protein
MLERILPLLVLAGCTGDEPATGTSEAALTCFHTATQVLCASGAPTTLADGRTKVEDFYPSACFDGDADLDGTPDFLDLDFLGSAAASVPPSVDAARCPVCNRGPGTQNDFRLQIAGAAAELDRGKVYTQAGELLTIPTPDGVLEVVTTAGTRFDDGMPAPGAEIRVEGSIVNHQVQATRLKVLCPAPAALPPGDVPPGAMPPQPDPSGPIL